MTNDKFPADQRSRKLLLPAWSTSILIHTIGLVCIALVVRSAPRGTGAEEVEIRSTGIVVVKRHAEEKEYFDGDQSFADPAAGESSAGGRESALPTEAEMEIDLSGDLPSTAGQPLSAPGDVGDGAGLSDAGQLGGGTGRGPTLGGSTKTKVFGIDAEGSRFVYVFDRSGSMSGFGGRPLRAAQTELVQSLEDLDRIHQFQIIFYNERPRFFSPDGSSPKLQWGDDAGKQLARRFVLGMTASGGTEHMQALTMALRMNPDVVFFLTDADEPQITAQELSQIDRLNHGTTIHAIEFGFGPQRNSDNFLVQLAHRNNGEHRYVDISKLRD